MSDDTIQIASAAVPEKGDGVRFDLPALGPHATGFVIRSNGVAYAYVNRCAHVPVELDWEHGKFFNLTQEWLICATHGAMYAPHTGYCVMGPCKGRQLTPIPLREQHGVIEIYPEQIGTSG